MRLVLKALSGIMLLVTGFAPAPAFAVGFLSFPLTCSTPLVGGACPVGSINYTIRGAYTANSMNSILYHSMKLRCDTHLVLRWVINYMGSHAGILCKNVFSQYLTYLVTNAKTTHEGGLFLYTVPNWACLNSMQGLTIMLEEQLSHSLDSD